LSSPIPHVSRPRLALLSCLAAAALAACGGGSVAESVNAAAVNVGAASAASAGGAVSTTVVAGTGVEAQPSFHMAPAQLAEPADVDVGGGGASAHAAPTRFEIPALAASLSTARLTPQLLAQRLAEGGRSASALSASATPAATTITATVYTPAQIRAAYGLGVLPAVGATLSASAAAALGAGQTVYVVDANHNPNALSDLNAFSAKFGLPSCSALSLGATTSLPLAAAGSSCSLGVAYTDGSALIKSAAPAYNASWASEIALDVQWVHAIAPLARIVLIEASDSMTNSLAGGVALANKMGAGIVSMSFGAAEGAWVTGLDATFATAGMTYVAASGDSGAQVNWPAVSPGVLAVGGTSLQWSGSGTRYEAAWSGSGGGVSAYESLPAWQSGVTLPGVGKPARRAVVDVAFNANPSTGQYVALTAPGATTTNWNAYGGTSIAAPQWAGLLAVANAQRVAASKAVLGDIHATLYASIAVVPGTYAAALADVVDGNDGSCASCAAATGFDQPTGWGTPNAAGLLTALTGVGVATPAVAPVVPGGAFVAKKAVALTQSLGITAPTGVTTTYAIQGGPTGLSVNAAGELKWTAPVLGSYTLTATATTSAGKSASGSYTLKVIPYTVPVFSGSAALTGTEGKAFSATVVASNPNTGTLGYSVGGAPSGLTISAAGVLSWASPVGGTYALAVTVTDGYGLSATRTYTLTVPKVNHAPVLSGGSVTVPAGMSLTIKLAGYDVDGDAITYTLTGAPSGLKLSAAGVITWAKTVKGSYALKVTPKDAKGLAGAVATVTLVVAG